MLSWLFVLVIKLSHQCLFFRDWRPPGVEQRRRRNRKGRKTERQSTRLEEGEGVSRGTGAGKRGREGAVKVKLSVTRWEGVGWGSIWR